MRTSPYLSGQGGFTLLELMVVVMIVGILAAAALPSYNQYIVRNAEMEVQSQLGSVQLELERWRTTAMSYRGFYPLGGIDTTGKSVYQYVDAKNTKIYVPIGSTAQNYRYEIELLDGETHTSLVKNRGTDISLGRSWVMRAIPNPNHRTVKTGRVFLQRSDGLKCVTKKGARDSELDIKYQGTACPSPNTEKW